MILTRLHQDVRSEMYQVGDEEADFGQLFIFYSPDRLFLDGYLYLNVEEEMTEEDADELGDEVVQHYLNRHCPLDHGQDFTTFEVNIIRDGQSYLVELEDDEDYGDDEYDDDIYDEDYNDDEYDEE